MDRYSVVRQIGEGSYGKALLVRSKKTGGDFVIKQIPLKNMSEKDCSEARKEVSVLQNLQHPYIVSLHESFEEKGTLYIVMEYAAKGDLFNAITTRNGKPFSEDQIMDWFVQLSLALKHIHDQKILHRDLKTQNVFLTKDNIIKLGDFGIAKVLKHTMQMARTIIGTPYYMSPECMQGQPYNNKSDVWSLGCILYEMATLKHAFTAQSMNALIVKIVRGQYPPIPATYSRELRSLVQDMLKQDPAQRPSVNAILRRQFVQARLAKLSTSAAAAAAAANPTPQAPLATPQVEARLIPIRKEEKLALPRPQGVMAPSRAVSAFDKCPRAPSAAPVAPGPNRNLLVPPAPAVGGRQGLKNISNSNKNHNSENAIPGMRPMPKVQSAAAAAPVAPMRKVEVVLAPRPPAAKEPKKEKMLPVPPPARERRSPTPPPSEPQQGGAKNYRMKQMGLEARKPSPLQAAAPMPGAPRIVIKEEPGMREARGARGGGAAGHNVSEIPEDIRVEASVCTEYDVEDRAEDCFGETESLDLSSIRSRMEALRADLLKALGPQMFHRVYGVAKDLFDRECSDEVIIKSPILMRLMGRDFQKNIQPLSALVAGEMAYVK